MNPQMNQNYDRELEQIRELITKNDSGVIVLPSKATPDAIAAGTSLYLALTKLGKNVALAAMPIPTSDLAAADKIQTKLVTGGDNLVISFPYRDGAIDKIDYLPDLENGRFQVIIVPRQGQAKLQSNDVEFNYSGGKIDFIITVDAPNLNALGEIYQKNQSMFQSKNVINIDRHLINNNYGIINLVIKNASSTSELIYKVISALKIDIDKDMATNLYSGIVTATNNVSSYSVNADTFEAVAGLMRAGAVKKPMRPMVAPFSQQSPYMMRPQMQNPQAFMNPFQNQNGGGIPIQQPMRPARGEQQSKAIEDVEKAPTDNEGNGNNTTADDNEENWLKPKVFSESGGLV